MYKVKNIFKSNFGKNVIMITGGTAIAQILTIIVSPIITRMYSPDDYGILTVYTAILGMISLLGALSYDSAIPIADDDESVSNILFLCIIIILLLTSIIFIVLMFFGKYILNLFDAEILFKYRYYIPLGFLVTGIYNILTNLALRRKDFKAITKTKLSQSISGNITKVILGITSFGPIGLILGTILGQSAGITTLAKPILKSNKSIFKSVNKKEILRNLKRYINFPLYSAPTIFLLSISSQIPVIFISGLYGADTAGLYGLALNITFLPMTFIGKSVQDVFYGEAASIGKKDPLMIKDLSNKLLKKLIIIGLIPIIILVFWGPDIFSIVFGKEWYWAGEYSRLLTLFAFAYLIFHPISVVFSIFERQKRFFVLNIIKLVIVLLIFTVSKLIGLNSYITVLLFSISMAIIELLKYIFAQKIMNEEIKKIDKHY